jgi:4-amino-4-deoxy-L-arabinose transferase-like glycosyltransferase
MTTASPLSSSDSRRPDSLFNFVLGIALVAFGQYMMGQPDPLFVEFAFTKTLNTYYRWDIYNLDNVIIGVVLFIIGGVLFVRAAQPWMIKEASPDLPKEETTTRWRDGIRATGGLLALAAALEFFLLWRLSQRDYNLLSPILWVIIIVLIIMAMWRWDRLNGRASSLAPLLDRRDVYAILAILMAGFVINAYQITNVPNIMMGDEGDWFTTARAVAAGDYNPPWFGFGVYSFPVLSSITAGWAMNFFGVSLWGWRFASAFAAVLTVIPLYALGREMFNRQVAVAASLIMIATPYFIAFARLGYNNSQSLFPVVLAFYFLFAGFKRGSWLYLACAGVVAALGFYTYTAARLAVLVALFYFLYLFLSRQQKLKQLIVLGVVFSLGFLGAVLPFLVYGNAVAPHLGQFKMLESLWVNSDYAPGLYPDQSYVKQITPTDYEGAILYWDWRLAPHLLSRGIARSILVFNIDSIVTEHFIAAPLAGAAIMAVLYILGLALMFGAWREGRAALLILWFVLGLMSLSIFNTFPPRHAHLVPLMPVVALFTAAGLVTITKVIVDRATRLTGTFKYMPITFGVLLLMFVGLENFFVQMPLIYRPDFESVLSWTVLNSAPNQKTIYVYSDNPSQANFRPFASRHLRPEAQYEPVAVESLDSLTLDSGSRYAVLYRPKNAPTIALKLQKIIPNVQPPFSIYNREGDVIGYAMTSRDVILAAPTDVWSGVVDLLRSPIWFVWIALALLAILTYFFKRSWLSRLPRLIPEYTFPELRGVTLPTITLPQLALPKMNLPHFSPKPKPPTQVAPPAAPVPVPAPVNVEPQPIAAHESSAPLSISASPSSGAPGVEIDLKIRLHLPQYKNFSAWQFPKLGAGSILQWSSFEFGNPAWLLGAIALAAVGQAAIFSQRFEAGMVLYALAMALAIYWAYRHPSARERAAESATFNSRVTEIILVAALILASAIARYYRLDQKVYGLEGDETKWTMQVWFSTITGEPRGDFSHHFADQPVDFWLKSAFMRVFGENFFSARVASATMSLLSIFIFYFLARRLTSKPVALLAALFYSFALAELSTARQALHDTPIEFWLIFGYFCVVTAVESRRSWHFALAGVTLALGMLTYETFYPAPIVAALYLLMWMIVEWRKPDEWREWIKRIVVTALPFVFVAPPVIHYIDFRAGYHLLALNAATRDDAGIASLASFLFKNFSELLVTLFYQIRWGDSLLRIEAPFINPLLLPFIVLGFLYTLWNWRRWNVLFTVIWFAVFALPIPLLGAPWPRVIYPALMPMMLWGALGVWLIFNAARNFYTQVDRRVVPALFCVLILVIVGNDVRLFTTQLIDPDDRRKRRELYDTVAASTLNTPMIYLPFEPRENDVITQESNLIHFAVGGTRHTSSDSSYYYQTLMLDDVMFNLWESRAKYSSLVVVADKTAFTKQDKRNALYATLRRCYPQTQITSGQFFDSYRLVSTDLASPQCYSTRPPKLVQPSKDETLPFAPVTFRWSSDSGGQTAHRLEIEQRRPRLIWIEGESFSREGGWFPESLFADFFSGTGYLTDAWKAGTATTTALVPGSGKYRLWLRSYKRVENDHHNLVTLNNRTLEFAENGSTLFRWTWKNMGEFDLAAGANPITLSRTYGASDQNSVFIDAIALTDDLTFDPERDPQWTPIFDSGDAASAADTFTLPNPLPAGDYRWRVRVFNGDKLLDASGKLGVASGDGIFSVK